MSVCELAAVLLVTVGASVATSALATERGCVTSTLGSASIARGLRSTYEVTKPCESDANKPLVVFVNYASEADRDYFSMPSVAQARTTPKTSVAYTYRFMADRLAQLGFPSVRNDPLGVGCSGGQAPPDDPALSPFCIRSLETSTLSRADYVEILGRVLFDPQEHLVDYAAAHGLVFVAHSGTTLVIKDLSVGPYRIDTMKAGLVGVAPLVSSGAANDVWQTSGVFKARIEECAASERLDFHFKRCVKKALSDAYAIKRIPDKSLQAILSACERHGPVCTEVSNAMLDEITRTLSRDLDEAAKANRVFSSPGGYAGTVKSHLEINGSKDSPCEMMAAMRPAVRIIFGGGDVALSAARQTEHWIACGGRADEVTVLPGMGHMLGPNVHTGPMAESSAQKVIDAVVEVAGQVTQRMRSSNELPHR